MVLEVETVKKRKQATWIVRKLGKSKSVWIQTLLWAPSVIMPFYWTFLTKRKPKDKCVHLEAPNGKYPDKRFFIIRVGHTNSGLAAIEPIIAGACQHAVNRGYIPVVDFLNSKTLYHENGETGKVNTWDYYYEQPGGFSLEDALSAKHILIEGMYGPWQSF